VTKATRAFVRERAKSRCEYCRAPEIITGGPFEVDHIVPQASAGGDELTNLPSLNAEDSHGVLSAVVQLDLKLSLARHKLKGTELPIIAMQSTEIHAHHV
jgi:HNH endonuclease